MRRLRVVSKSDTSTRDALAIEHLEWARGIARHVAGHLPTWFTEDDLTGPAEIALLKLAAKYDPSRGIPFRAFAQRRIFGACIDSVRRREYKERGHQSLSPFDGSAVTHGQGEYRAASDKGSSRPINARKLQACLASPGPSPEQQAASHQDVRVWEVVQKLPSRHMLVILSVYGGGSSLVELSEKAGVGAARLSQIHREALGMLRCEMEKAA